MANHAPDGSVPAAFGSGPDATPRGRTRRPSPSRRGGTSRSRGAAGARSTEPTKSYRSRARERASIERHVAPSATGSAPGLGYGPVSPSSPPPRRRSCRSAPTSPARHPRSCSCSPSSPPGWLGGLRAAVVVVVPGRARLQRRVHRAVLDLEGRGMGRLGRARGLPGRRHRDRCVLVAARPTVSGRREEREAESRALYERLAPRGRPHAGARADRRATRRAAALRLARSPHAAGHDPRRGIRPPRRRRLRRRDARRAALRGLRRGRAPRPAGRQPAEHEPDRGGRAQARPTGRRRRRAGRRPRAAPARACSTRCGCRSTSRPTSRSWTATTRSSSRCSPTCWRTPPVTRPPGSTVRIEAAGSTGRWSRSAWPTRASACPGPRAARIFEPFRRGGGQPLERRRARHLQGDRRGPRRHDRRRGHPRRRGDVRVHAARRGERSAPT